MQNKTGLQTIKHFTVIVALCAAQQVVAKDAAALYPKMAPIEQYLMTENAEIALALSAAPDSIARDADVLILGRRGFEAAVKGNNGFVCIVGRSWTAAADTEFWNPKVRVPMCVNAAAAHSYLLRDNKITELALAGQTPAQITGPYYTAVADKELPPMEAGAMCYMMSKRGYAGDSVPHWPSHVMFFYSDVDPASWGANLKGSPIVAISDPQEHLTQFVVATQKWSDGTEARSSLHVHPSSSKTR